MLNRLSCYFASFILTFVALVLSTALAHASFSKAVEHYQKKDYAEAYYSFKNLAFVGNADSQFNLGVMYYRGEHVEQDVVQAYGWMKLASTRGDERYIKLANKVYDGMDDKAKEAAEVFAAKLSQQYGEEILAAALAPRPLSDDDCTQDPKSISIPPPKYPARASETGQLGYVDILLNISPQGYGRDISVRTITDKQFFRAAAKSAYRARWEPKLVGGQAVTARGVMYRFTFSGWADGVYTTDKFVSSVSSLKEKAEGGDAKAQYQYAKSLSSARSFRKLLKGVDLEYQVSNEWFARSAAGGNPRAQYEIGKNMLYGRGCEVDTETGLKWLRAAAIAGHAFAQEELAMSTLDHGVSDIRRTMTWLRLAAEKDSYAPKLFLAWELSANPGAAIHDAEEALQLLKAKPEFYYDDVRISETKAAAYARSNDFAKAVRWQKKALKQARAIKWDIPVMERRLAAYESGIPWTGVYHEPVMLTSAE